MIEFLPNPLQLPLSSPIAVGIVTAGVSIGLCLMRQLLLPKPIAGIPYNADSASSLLGDVKLIQKESTKNPIAWIVKQTKRHNSPICQLFLLPFGKPCILISDFREGQDILMRRKEFDRSSFTIAMLGGEAPYFHANMPTGPAWRAHRELLQGLMSSDFLHSVAAPNIYQSASRLIELWTIKSQIAEPLPFAADRDIFFAALDALYDFGYGSNAPERALIRQLEGIKGMTASAQSQLLENATTDGGVCFPVCPIPPSMEAILKSSNNVLPPYAVGFARLAWWLMGLNPRVRETRNIRNHFIKDQLLKSATNMESEAAGQGTGSSGVKSAVDHIVERERLVAEKHGRPAIYCSNAIQDEVFGFVAAGHDTVSTVLCWGVKFLSDNPSAQHRLRKELQQVHKLAVAENRQPTHVEITESATPYLDAVLQEMIRLANITPLLDRECTEDTVIFGHHIPKGTFIFIANKGPGFTERGIRTDEGLRSDSCRAALQGGKTRVLQDSDEVLMDQFRPERWLTRDKTSGKDMFDIGAWPAMPFSLGIRSCFGRKLAMMELKIIVSVLVWVFEFLPCAEAISSYDDIQVKLREPRQCYVLLRRLPDHGAAIS